MKTRITELFGIEHPIILSGMSWISVPKMVAAVSNAGGLGILATGPLDADRTRQARESHLAGVRDAVAARADGHVALDLGPGAGQAKAGVAPHRGEGEQGGGTSLHISDDRSRIALPRGDGGAVGHRLGRIDDDLHADRNPGTGTGLP